MARFALPSIFVSLLFTCLPVRAEVSITWNFKEGAKFYVEKVETIKLSAELINKLVSNDSEITTVIGFRPVKVDGATVTLEQTFEGGKVKGDSESNAAVQKTLDRLKGASVLVTIGPDGRVLKIEGYDEAIKKLSGGAEENAASLKALFNKSTITASATEIFGFLPGKVVNAGDKWTKPIKFPIGPFGSLRGEYEFTLKGKEKGSKEGQGEEQEIAVTTTLGFDLPSGGTIGDDLKLARGEFQSEKASGSYWFSTATGRLVRSKIAFNIKGTLTIEKKGNGVSANIELKTNSKSRVLDKNPLE